jgi:hypothetical protein
MCQGGGIGWILDGVLTSVLGPEVWAPVVTCTLGKLPVPGVANRQRHVLELLPP